jgi:hypothetical protein
MFSVFWGPLVFRSIVEIFVLIGLSDWACPHWGLQRACAPGRTQSVSEKAIGGIVDSDSVAISRRTQFGEHPRVKIEGNSWHG